MAGKKRKSASDKQPKQQRLRLGADADAVADVAKRRRSGASKKHQAEEEAFIPSSLSAKILHKALNQQQEESLANQRPLPLSPRLRPSPSPSPTKTAKRTITKMTSMSSMASTRRATMTAAW
ncbi:hypothetical protein E2562_007440 [Oryza meyeriana var. granulata]|uniref:Uncharacterized protein n=1 Tax=Oryza meyeriana var. granulata TaxID=110450 RepID=A0A6G1D008_9ORYZ|nr:hypothetical protein E2562_007440 [Oryza meyeriana var. granulata]